MLGMMEPRQAELVLLRSQDLSYEELASALDLNPASAGTRSAARTRRSERSTSNDMETNHESNDSRWVEERLSALSDNGEWHPDPSLGLTRLRGGRERHRRAGRRRGLTVALATASSVSLAAFPVAQTFAGRCLLACVAETGRLFGPRQPHPGTTPVSAKLEAGVMAPDFTLRDASGQPVRLSGFRGKAVLLNFWATWCPPCRIEIPWFMEFQRAYGDRGLVVLGVSLDADGWKSVQPYVEARESTIG